MNDKTRITLETLITEREGMIAKNLQRRSNGQVMAYVQENFNSLAERIRNLLEEKAPSTIGHCLDEETGIYDSMALDKAKEQAWKREAWQEVINLIKARQRVIHSLGSLTGFGAGRLHEMKEICTAIKELCSP